MSALWVAWHRNWFKSPNLTFVDEVTTAATVCSGPNLHRVLPSTKALPVIVTCVPPFEGPLGGCTEASTGVAAVDRVHSTSTSTISQPVCVASLIITYAMSYGLPIFNVPGMKSLLTRKSNIFDLSNNKQHFIFLNCFSNLIKRNPRGGFLFTMFP